MVDDTRLERQKPSLFALKTIKNRDFYVGILGKHDHMYTT